MCCVPHATDRTRTSAERIDERIDERVAILLTWLHHAAGLWRKCATHPNHHIWWATNVAPVLDAVAAWRRIRRVKRAGPRGRRHRKRCTDDHITARRGCRTGPGKSGRWLSCKTHNERSQNQVGLVAWPLSAPM